MTYRFVNGDSLEILPRINCTADVVVMDPPYNAGTTITEKSKPLSIKYGIEGTSKQNLPVYANDSMSNRAWEHWMTDILAAARNKTQRGGLLYCFISWHNLPDLTDAVQYAGWQWKGLAVWHKPSRPRMGRPRQNAEFIVVATNGVRRPAAENLVKPSVPGVIYHANVPSAKAEHVTQKPVPLVETMLGAAQKNGLILDPFAGVASAGIAAQNLGLDYVGIEKEKHYHKIGLAKLEENARRLQQAVEAA